MGTQCFFFPHLTLPVHVAHLTSPITLGLWISCIRVPRVRANRAVNLPCVDGARASSFRTSSSFLVLALAALLCGARSLPPSVARALAAVRRA